MGWINKLLSKGNDEVKRTARRMDGWANPLTGTGTSADKTTFNTPTYDLILSPNLLETMYHGDDIAARCVSAILDEAFREEWKIVTKCDDDSKAAELAEQCSQLEVDFKTLGVREKFYEGSTWGRLYGLGGIVMGLDDGEKDLTKPFNIAKLKNILYLTAFDKRDIIAYSYYADPLAKGFGDVAVYQYQPLGTYGGQVYDPSGQAINTILRIHESRLIRFGGELTAKQEKLRNQGADFSVLQKCFRALQLANGNWEAAATLLADASQGVYKIQGLIEMIAAEPNVMQDRMGMVDRMKSTLRGIILDKDGEEYDRVPTPFGGIPEMLAQTWQRLASAARMPLTVLMGTSPGGLNATGDSDIRWWYDTVASIQRKALLPQLERLIAMLCQIHGYDASLFTVDFGSLWQMSEKDEALTELSKAQADQIYIVEGVKLPEEVSLEIAARDNSSAINTAARKMSLRAKLAVGLNAILQKQGTLEPPDEVDGDDDVIDAEVGQEENTPGETTDG